MSLFGKKKEKVIENKPISQSASMPGDELDPSDPMYLIKKARAMGIDLSPLADAIQERKMKIFKTYEDMEKEKLDRCIAELKPHGLGTASEARAMVFIISMLLTESSYAAPTKHMKMEDTTPELWKSYAGLVNSLAAMDLGEYYSIKDEDKIQKIVRLAIQSQGYPIYE